MAAQTSKTPSKETVNFLYKGLAFFYPRTIFGEEKAKTLGYLKTWSGMQSADFALFVTNITKTEDVEDAAKKILSWKRAYDNQEYPDATIPENLDELVSSLEEISDQKGDQAEKARLAKKALLQSEIAKEKGEIEVEKEPDVKQQFPTEKEVSKDTPQPPETPSLERFVEGQRGIVLEIIKRTDLNPIARGVLKVATLPFFLAAPKVASTPEGQVTASAQHILFQKHITSIAFAGIRPKALSLGISPKEFDNLLTTIAQQERAYPGLYNRISSGFGIQEIVVRTGIPQAVAGQIFLTPSSPAGSLVVPKRGLLGNLLGRMGQQIFGGLFKGTVTKSAAKGAVTKAVTTIAKLEPHVRVAAWIMTGLSAVVNFFKGKGDKEGVGGTVTTVALFAGGLFLLPVAPIIGVGVLGAGTLAGGATLAGKAGGYGNLASKAGEIGQALLAGGISAAGAGIGIPLLISLVSIPIIVAIILFIINSGAYMVPPRETISGTTESPYIDVKKEAVPDCLNRDGCPNLPGSITYTVEVKAKKGTLTNIHLDNKYDIFGEGTNNFEVQEIEPPTIISPIDAFTFSYTVNFDENQNNSVVYDTITITADAPEQAGAVAADVASVIIGTPPASSCPIMGGSISTGSYVGDREIGHGSNSYWGSSANCTNYAIPAFSGCHSPTSSVDTDGNNFCQGLSQSCPYYGFATDVGGSGGTPVFMPSIFGESINWKFVRKVTINNTAWGWGYLFEGSGYELYLGHLNNTSPPSVLPSGTTVGTLFPGLSSPHVHIELQINGQYVKPDFLCGGPGP